MALKNGSGNLKLCQTLTALLDNLSPVFVGHALNGPLRHSHARIVLESRLVDDQEIPMEVIEWASLGGQLELRVVGATGVIV